MRRRVPHNKGFTLLEILIAISILSLFLLTAFGFYIRTNGLYNRHKKATAAREATARFVKLFKDDMEMSLGSIKVEAEKLSFQGKEHKGTTIRAQVPQVSYIPASAVPSPPLNWEVVYLFTKGDGKGKVEKTDIYRFLYDKENRKLSKPIAMLENGAKNLEIKPGVGEPMDQITLSMDVILDRWGNATLPVELFIDLTK